jgi:hypothetical protein
MSSCRPGVYTALLLLWPQLVEELAGGDGTLLAGAGQGAGSTLRRQLGELLRTAASAEEFACAASWLVTL